MKRVTTQTAWTLTIDPEWVAWLTFDRLGEKVNTFTSSSMGELETLIDALADNEQIKAVAIRSGKPQSFIAGADINELSAIDDQDDARDKAAAGQRVFSKIEALPVPSVAVIHGSCMGGGLELALACTYRLVSNDAKTSLAAPEVKLGIIPGWGGTQRLPRLIGLAAALPLILTGKTINGRKAIRMGLADGVVAHAFAHEQTNRFIDRVLKRKGRDTILKKRRKRRSRWMRWLEATPPGRGLILRSARKQTVNQTHGNYPAPLAAISVMRDTGCRGDDEAYQRERGAFAKLAVTPESRHLTGLFQASRRVKQSADAADAGHVQRAGVIGAGIMGSGIAYALAEQDIAVRLRDIEWDALARGMSSAATIGRGAVKRRKKTAGELNQLMHRIEPTVEMTGFGNADIVIEAVAEDLAIKQRVLEQIEAVVSPDTIICTNTSSLPLGELAGVLKHPKRFIGLHFFNPVHRMPLVEVVPGPKTSKQTTAIAAGLMQRLGKTAVITGDCPGFLVNRVLIPYLVEAAWMVEEGIDPRRIDRVLERFGMPMGPLMLADTVGLDVGYKAAQTLEAAYGSRMRVGGLLGQLVDAGCHGKKSGRGVYDHTGKKVKVNNCLAAVAAASREADGVTPCELTDQEIIDRAVLMMVNEAARCLDERVVSDAETLDLAMVFGTGFAPFRGGVLHYADDRGMRPVHDRMVQFAELFGDRFAPCAYLAKLAKRNGRFHEHREDKGVQRDVA